MNENERIQADEAAQATPPTDIRDTTDGDVFCEDDSAFIGDYSDIAKVGPPLEISVYYKKHWWIYKLDRKEKVEDVDEPANAG